MKCLLSIFSLSFNSFEEKQFVFGEILLIPMCNLNYIPILVVFLEAVLGFAINEKILRTPCI